MESSFLNNVYGYNNIKEELYLIREWYFNRDESNKKLMLPRGILFYGDPGYGKTHIIREYSKCFNYPVFVIEGKDDNVQEEVSNIYEKAKKEKNAIVIIDELDKLIDKDSKLVRVIMSELDGFDTKSSVLTLATCNFYFDIPDELKREGRFDRHYYVGMIEDINEIIRSFSNDVGIVLNDNEIYELGTLLDYYSICEIKAVFNNAVLRYGSKCTIDDIIDIADFLKTGFVKKNEDYVVTRQAAIHEAGHALYAHLFCNTKQFLRIYFNEYGGVAVCKDISKNETKESRINDVRVGLAGVVAEDMLLNGHGVGCGDDLDRVYDLSFRLVNRTCINGIDRFCPQSAYRNRYNMSEYNNKEYDRKTIKFIKENY